MPGVIVRGSVFWMRDEVKTPRFIKTYEPPLFSPAIPRRHSPLFRSSNPERALPELDVPGRIDWCGWHGREHDDERPAALQSPAGRHV